MPEKKDIANSLLQHNYFPVQKKTREEFPPLFNSSAFDEDVATKLTRTKTRLGGYDQVEYLATRFNNVPRTLSIPHPMPYACLVLEIQSNWDNLKDITTNENSVIKPQKHSDGRIIVMDYEQSQTSAHRHLNKAQSKKYIVHTDISNFFHSIYTHAIPWALVGLETAKKEKLNHGMWYNKLDKYQRLCKRDETMGIPIGPGTSNIISECILEKIDSHLEMDGFEFTRYIDDYTSYCSSREEADRFIISLTNKLREYKLSLNLKKTHIKELPVASSSDWISDLSTRLPKSKKTNHYDAIKFLDYAVNIQNQTPDGSILKYAVKTVAKKVNIKGRLSVAKYALNLAFKYPIIIPLLDNLVLGLGNLTTFNLSEKLTSILKDNIVNKRSDGISWSLYLLKRHCNHAIPNKTADEIILTEDTISILTLYALNQHQSKVLIFANEIVKRDILSIDEQWILLYQLFFDNHIQNPYSDTSLYDNIKTKNEQNSDAMRREIICFDTLKSSGVSFVDNHTLQFSKMERLKSSLLKSIYSRMRRRIGV